MILRTSYLEKKLQPSNYDIVIIKGGNEALCSSEIDMVLRSNNISRNIKELID